MTICRHNLPMPIRADLRDHFLEIIPAMYPHDCDGPPEWTIRDWFDRETDYMTRSISKAAISGLLALIDYDTDAGDHWVKLNPLVWPHGSAPDTGRNALWSVSPAIGGTRDNPRLFFIFAIDDFRVFSHEAYLDCHHHFSDPEVREWLDEKNIAWSDEYLELRKADVTFWKCRLNFDGLFPVYHPVVRRLLEDAQVEPFEKDIAILLRAVQNLFSSNTERQLNAQALKSLADSGTYFYHLRQTYLSPKGLERAQVLLSMAGQCDTEKTEQN